MSRAHGVEADDYTGGHAKMWTVDIDHPVDFTLRAHCQASHPPLVHEVGASRSLAMRLHPMRLCLSEAGPTFVLSLACSVRWPPFSAELGRFGESLTSIAGFWDLYVEREWGPAASAYNMWRHIGDREM